MRIQVTYPTDRDRIVTLTVTGLGDGARERDCDTCRTTWSRESQTRFHRAHRDGVRHRRKHQERHAHRSQRRRRRAQDRRTEDDESVQVNGHRATPTVGWAGDVLTASTTSIKNCTILICNTMIHCVLKTPLAYQTQLDSPLLCRDTRPHLPFYRLCIQREMPFG